MKKLMVTVLVLCLALGGVAMMPQQEVQSLSPFVVNGNRFLRVRPNSNKSHTELTYTQFMSFYGTLDNLVNQAITSMRDVDADWLLLELDVLSSEVSGLTSAQFQAQREYYYNLYESMYMLYAQTLESRAVEGRGMWHRPYERNLDEVRRTLADHAAMGINMLFVETFWLGRLIYPSAVEPTFQHGFTLGGYRDANVDYGTDLLKAFVEEAKAFDIEIHAWVENFFVGFGTSPTASPILAARPDWASYNHDGTIVQKFEQNYLFMDPANPEVRDYLKALYVEMATGYDIATIHLDYIRYPVAQNVTSAPSSNRDTGYSAYAERAFLLEHNLTGDLRELVVGNQQIAQLWREFKTGVISRFVAGVYYEVKRANPEVGLSTAIFGNINDALTTKMQDWVSWSDEGYIEIITPMAYYQSATTVRNEIARLTDVVGNHAFSYGGIAPSYMGYNDHLNSSQIEASLSGGAQGVVFFASQFYMVHSTDGTNPFNTKVQNILQTGTFRNAAIRPHDDTSQILQVSVAEMLRKADTLYVPRDAMTPAARIAYEQALQSLISMPHDTRNDLLDLIEALKAFNPDLYASNPARTRIQEDIDYLITLLSIKAERKALDAAIDLDVNPDLPFDLPPLEALPVPGNLRFDGPMLRWDAVSSSVGYRLMINGFPIDVQGTELDLRTLSLRTGDNHFAVAARADGVRALDSLFSETLHLTLQPLGTPTNLRVVNGILHFDTVPMAEAYRVRLGTLTQVIESQQLDLRGQGPNTFRYEIQVTALGNGYETTQSQSSSVLRYPRQTLLDLDQLFRQHVSYILND